MTFEEPCLLPPLETNLDPDKSNVISKSCSIQKTKLNHPVIRNINININFT